MVEPLTRAQQMFNQRLMASHCLSETKAKNMWNQCRKVCAGDNEENCEKLEEALIEINAQLKYIGLEIRGVSIAPSRGGAGSSTQSSDGSGSRRSSGGSNHPTRYYAIINKFPDDVAKHCFSSGVSNQEAAFARHVVETLASAGGDPIPRSQLLNGRTDVKDNVKVTLPQAENVVERLLNEKWLMHETSINSRRGSNAGKIMLAPRTYLELSYFLEEAGMEPDNLPQLIYHTD